MNGRGRALRFGEGRISGYLSALLGVCSLGAVLCFLFPDLLTTDEFRGVLYSVTFARRALWWALVVAFVTGTLSFLLGGGRRMAALGIASSTFAILLGGADVTAGSLDGEGPSFGLDWFILALLVSMLIFIPLEKAFAQRPQNILRPEWRTDLAYFFFGHLLITFYLLFTNSVYESLFDWAISNSLQQWVQARPVVLQFIACVFMADLFQYATHRFYHRVGWLWRFHSVHHSSRSLDWLAGSRMHLVEIALTRTAVVIPLYLIGFAESALNAYVVLVGVQAVFAHANVGWRFGPLEYLLVTPRYHHWHHSRDPAYRDANYAVHLPVIDMMFGTYRFPNNQWPSSFGIPEDPVPSGFWRQLVHPFRT